jgi:hypothetical protein
MLYTMDLLGAMSQYTEPLPQAWQGVSAAQVALDPGQENFIRRVKSRIRLNYTRWEETNVLVDKLRGAENPAIVAKSLQVTDLRNVFVAAWQARIRLAENFIADGEAGEPTGRREARRNRYAADLRTIAERARDTCIAVIDRSSDEEVVPDASQLPPLSPSPGNTDFGLPPGQWAGQK